MYSIQSNSARFIYTLNYKENQNKSNQCRLKSGLYFSKESRSDEKIRYTETDMYSIMRTILFLYTFRVSPNESLLEIVNTGQVNYHFGSPVVVDLDLHGLIGLYDTIFGKNFSNVTSRVLNKCFNEYATIWQYFPYENSIKCPSASDFINCAKFVNACVAEYAPCEKFITTNGTDHKIPLQQAIKKLT
ncbi:GrBNV gp61-like protein [Tomelloso virus]|uniref:GrBNV gp61-like protein n=1 Tax=Tomelloso virus TaxID=2053981 RepID=A0A2H4T2T7_9VIRU|nr:GrBNV gp61-like protein [Tomelloso virus]ATY70245.1 GrBNV gp61-like protein [Tomelloso virus]